MFRGERIYYYLMLSTQLMQNNSSKMPTPTCGSTLLSRQVQQLFRMNSRISVLAGRIEFVTYKYKNNNGNILLCVVPGMQGPNIVGKKS